MAASIRHSIGLRVFLTAVKGKPDPLWSNLDMCSPASAQRLAGEVNPLAIYSVKAPRAHISSGQGQQVGVLASMPNGWEAKRVDFLGTSPKWSFSFWCPFKHDKQGVPAQNKTCPFESNGQHQVWRLGVARWAHLAVSGAHFF